MGKDRSRLSAVDPTEILQVICTVWIRARIHVIEIDILAFNVEMGCVERRGQPNC